MRFTVNCSILLTNLPVSQRPTAAKEAGFDAVEFWWPFDTALPTDQEVDGFVRSITDAGVTLSGLNFAAGNLAAGERGLLSDPRQSATFRESVEIALAIGDRLGTTVFNALYGNRRDDLDPDEQDATAVENLAHAAERAERQGAAVVLEPLSAIPAYPLKMAADALAVMDRVRAPSLRLLADLYHLHVNGDDVAAVIATHVDRIGHVQIADAPGRGAPGTGTIDLRGHLQRLTDVGYRGYVGLEYHGGDDPFGWLDHR